MIITDLLIIEHKKNRSILLEKKDLHAIVFRMKNILVYFNYFSRFNFTQEKMAMCSMVILKDGSEVPKTTFENVRKKLEKLKEEGNFGVLVDLHDMCLDNTFQPQKNPFQDSKILLKERCLLQANDEINPDIQKIVLNCLEGRGLTTKFVDAFSLV
ncbi:MAG TPA: hypothetical protein VLG49_02390 [Rhabdochlamydiaceae bacterium]|nr:hypothetical protein [Rhabdochlamydiaceae bacterium]